MTGKKLDCYSRSREKHLSQQFSLPPFCPCFLFTTVLRPLLYAVASHFLDLSHMRQYLGDFFFYTPVVNKTGGGRGGDWSWCRAVYLIILTPTAQEMPTSAKAYMLEFWNIVRMWVIPFKGSGGIMIFLSEIYNTKPTSPWWQARSWIAIPEAERNTYHNNSVKFVRYC